MSKSYKWHPFDKSKGSRQLRPPMYKWVLVRLQSKDPDCLPDGLAVGYRKNAAGDKQCPYFVIPGIGGEVLAWCDCLPDDFEYSKKESKDVPVHEISA